MAQEVGPWTDLYSVGCMAYELVTGRLPFADTEAPTAILLRHVNDVPPPPNVVRARTWTRGVSDWIDGLLAKDPARRPRSAAEAWEALEEIVLAARGPALAPQQRPAADRRRRGGPGPVHPAALDRGAERVGVHDLRPARVGTPAGRDPRRRTAAGACRERRARSAPTARTPRPRRRRPTRSARRAAARPHARAAGPSAARRRAARWPRGTRPPPRTSPPEPARRAAAPRAPSPRHRRAPRVVRWASRRAAAQPAPGRLPGEATRHRRARRRGAARAARGRRGEAHAARPAGASWLGAGRDPRAAAQGRPRRGARDRRRRARRPRLARRAHAGAAVRTSCSMRSACATGSFPTARRCASADSPPTATRGCARAACGAR